MSFAWPLCFLLFLPLLVAAWRMLRRGRRSGIKFPGVANLPAKTAGWRAIVSSFAPFVMLLGLALLVIAAARPRKQIDRSTRNIEAIAMVMTVDISDSMNALDLTKKGEEWRTRLDVVKELFEKFVEVRSDDLIGLVTFGGYASGLVPLTADHEALLKVLRKVQTPTIKFDENGKAINPEEAATAIGDGLVVALDRLRNNTEVKSKIVILLSDGESNTGAVQPDEAAEIAKRLGIKVYTIGVGTNSEKTPYRTRDMFGRSIVQYANLIFDEKQLKSIAAKTGGCYFGVRDAAGLEAALEEIDKLEKTPLERSVYQRYHEFFVPFLLVGVLLVFLATLLQTVSSRRLV